MVSSDGVKPCLRFRKRIRFDFTSFLLSTMSSSPLALVANRTTWILREVGEKMRRTKWFLKHVGPVRDATAHEEPLVQAAIGSPPDRQYP